MCCSVVKHTDSLSALVQISTLFLLIYITLEQLLNPIRLKFLIVKLEQQKHLCYRVLWELH